MQQVFQNLSNQKTYFYDSKLALDNVKFCSIIYLNKQCSLFLKLNDITRYSSPNDRYLIYETLNEKKIENQIIIM